MRLGLVGSGNMARALAVGLGQPVLCTDVVPERAASLAADTGGEAVTGNGELARRADLVVLCHKPGQLDAVAEQVGGQARGIVSILAGVPVARLRAAYPQTPLVRVMPNTAIAVGRGVVAMVEGEDPDLERRVRELLEPAALVVGLAEAQMDAATATTGVLPAYLALFAEATIDAAVRHGIPPADADRMVHAGLAGAAALLVGDGDARRVRRAVTSPGGATAKGLRELERGGLRAAVDDAFDAAAGTGPAR